MIGPVTEIFEVPDYQAVDWFLPATAHEIAAQIGWPVARVRNNLSTLRAKRWAKKTARMVPTGDTGRGAKSSAIWVAI